MRNKILFGKFKYESTNFWAGQVMGLPAPENRFPWAGEGVIRPRKLIFQGRAR
jgi:hypothetical protein